MKNTVFQSFNPEDWVVSGGGKMGTSYFHKSDPSLMLKMSNFTVSPVLWQREMDNGRAFMALGLSTPEPVSIVTDGKNYGLVYKRISGKISYAAALGKTTCDEQIDDLARNFAEDVKKLHSTVAGGGVLRNVKDVVRENILRNTVRERKIIDAAVHLLVTLPDGDTVIHGDLHFGNVIKAADKDYFIDLGDAAYGHPMFDMAMFAWVVAMGEAEGEEFQHNVYHHSLAQCNRFYKTYLDTYFARPVDPSAFEQELMPYISLRLLSIEAGIGHKIPSPINQRVDSYLEHLCKSRK